MAQKREEAQSTRIKFRGGFDDDDSSPAKTIVADCIDFVFAYLENKNEEKELEKTGSHDFYHENN